MDLTILTNLLCKLDSEVSADLPCETSRTRSDDTDLDTPKGDGEVDPENRFLILLTKFLLCFRLPNLVSLSKNEIFQNVSLTFFLQLRT